MNKTKYEKHIADLEEQIEMLRSDNKRLGEMKELEIAKHFKSKEEFSRGLLLFLNETYQQLAKIQAVIMKNIGVVNHEIVSMNGEVSSRVIGELNKMLMLNGHNRTPSAEVDD